MSYPHNDMSSGKKASSTSKPFGDLAEDLSEKAGAQVDRARAGIEGAADEVGTRGREAAEHAQAVVGNFKTAVEKSTRDHPITTLAMAVAMGFLIGAMWK